MSKLRAENVSSPVVYVSYSHNDQRWRDRVRAHLAVLEQSRIVEVWDDHQIDAGSEWSEEIRTAMGRTTIALLLISANYLASQWTTTQEVPFFLEQMKDGKATILPLMVSRCDWKGVRWLSEIQILPRGAKPLSEMTPLARERALAELTEWIREIATGSVVRAKPVTTLQTSEETSHSVSIPLKKLDEYALNAHCSRILRVARTLATFTGHKIHRVSTAGLLFAITEVIRFPKMAVRFDTSKFLWDKLHQSGNSKYLQVFQSQFPKAESVYLNPKPPSWRTFLAAGESITLIRPSTLEVFKLAAQYAEQTADGVINVHHLLAALLAFNFPTRTTGAVNRLLQMGVEVPLLRQQLFAFILKTFPRELPDVWKEILGGARPIKPVRGIGQSRALATRQPAGTTQTGARARSETYTPSALSIGSLIETLRAQKLIISRLDNKSRKSQLRSALEHGIIKRDWIEMTMNSRIREGNIVLLHVPEGTPGYGLKLEENVRSHVPLPPPPDDLQHGVRFILVARSDGISIASGTRHLASFEIIKLTHPITEEHIRQDEKLSRSKTAQLLFAVDGEQTVDKRIAPALWQLIFRQNPSVAAPLSRAFKAVPERTAAVKKSAAKQSGAKKRARKLNSLREAKEAGASAVLGALTGVKGRDASAVKRGAMQGRKVASKARRRKSAKEIKPATDADLAGIKPGRSSIAGEAESVAGEVAVAATEVTTEVTTAGESAADAASLSPRFQSAGSAGGATALRSEPPPAPTAGPAATVHQVVWQTIRQEALREQNTFTTHTLDIHLTPRVTSVESNLSLNGAGSRYEVVLTLAEQIEAKPQIRYFEGPLQLERLETDAAAGATTRQYGANLHRALFNDATIDRADQLLEGELRQHTLASGYKLGLARRALQQRILRLQLRINTQSPELHRYRWEYLWDDENDGPLACLERTPFARVLHVSSADDSLLPAISLVQPLRVLAAMASPADLSAAEDEQEHELLRGLAPLDRAEIESLKLGLNEVGPLISPLEGDNILASPDDFVSLEVLRRRLVSARRSGRPFHVLHLLCHGVTLAESGKSGLILTNDQDKRADFVPEEIFADMLRQFTPELRLIVLASCFTALPTREQPLQGIGRRLVAAGIPAVVAMQDALEFEAAQHFSQRLYAELIGHGEIDRAVNAARRELYDRRRTGARDRRPGKVSPRQWGIPVLFMRLPDGRLLDVTRADAAAPFDTRALPYGELPGSDPGRLVADMIQASAAPPGLMQSVPSLAQTLREVLQEVRAPTPVAKITSAFEEFVGQESLRGKLIQAAGEHRRHPARRAVLFLRGLARARIASLVHQSQLASLNARLFRETIWDEGAVMWDTEVSYRIGDGGPAENCRAVIDGVEAEITSTLWRTCQRGFHADTGDDIHASFRVTGNLTWANGQQQLSAKRFPSPADLERLLYGHGEAFEVFDELTADQARQLRGLNQRTASLLLHAVAPDRYLPYHAELANAVLDRLWPHGSPPYSNSYRDYCSLASELLADEDMGLEDLADVGYFLQRLAHGGLPLPEQVKPSFKGRVMLRPLRLRAEAVDSELVVRRGVLNQATAALNAGKHIILIGPPGTGKTTLAENLCRHARDLDCNRGHVLVTAVADWTTFDTIGGYMPESGDHLVFRPGLFLNAIETQKWLVIDEINRADIDKAFGELFTVLSGQVVTLPYDDRGRTVRILPPGRPTSESTRDYAIHPSWRIIGTMNVYDKASLFSMSYAFMRRFAFIDVDVPQSGTYRRLVKHFLQSAGLADGEEHQAVRTLYELFDQGGQNSLMRWRALGPAISKDMVRYLCQRRGDEQFSLAHLAEALLLYVVPQFDGLERENIVEIYHQLERLFPPDGEDADARLESEVLRRRIEGLFPFITDWNQGG